MTTMFSSLVHIVLVATVTWCLTSAHSGEDFSSEGVGPTGARCVCSTRRNPCSSGILSIIGCPSTNNYIQCSGTSCTVQTCSSGQVWSVTQSSCAPCPTGQHVTGDGRRCVCNQGTTLNQTSGSCVACPALATTLPDLCYCAPPLAFNRVNNTCQTCPSITTTLRGDDCVCTDRTTFFSSVTWSCQPCPGQFVQTGGRGRQQCRCTGLNQIFYRSAVTCFTCPTGTTVDRDGDECLCPVRGQKFNMSTGTCQCKTGFTLVSGICQLSVGTAGSTSTLPPLTP